MQVKKKCLQEDGDKRSTDRRILLSTFKFKLTFLSVFKF